MRLPPIAPPDLTAEQRPLHEAMAEGIGSTCTASSRRSQTAR